MTSRRAIRTLVCLVTAALVGGCGGGSDRVSQPLTFSDLRAVNGLPADISVTKLSLGTGDPDPRGPCGAKVPALDLSRATGVSIRATALQGVEVVVRTSTATAKRLLDARIADARPGCSEFQTTTNTGATQRTHLDRIIPLRSAGDQSLATQQAVLVDGKVTSVTIISMRRAGTVGKIVLFGANPLSVETTQGLATRAAARL